MISRASDIRPFFFERGLRGSVRRALLALLVIIALMLYVGGKVRIVRLGY